MRKFVQVTWLSFYENALSHASRSFFSYIFHVENEYGDISNECTTWDASGILAIRSVVGPSPVVGIVYFVCLLK